MIVILRILIENIQHRNCFRLVQFLLILTHLDLGIRLELCRHLSPLLEYTDIYWKFTSPADCQKTQIYHKHHHRSLTISKVWAQAIFRIWPEQWHQGRWPGPIQTGTFRWESCWGSKSWTTWRPRLTIRTLQCCDTNASTIQHLTVLANFEKCRCTCWWAGSHPSIVPGSCTCDWGPYGWRTRRCRIPRSPRSADNLRWSWCPACNPFWGNGWWYAWGPSWMTVSRVRCQGMYVIYLFLFAWMLYVLLKADAQHQPRRANPGLRTSRWPICRQRA